MKAAVVTRYGPPEVVQVRKVPEPQPKRGEVVVRVEAATVNSGDARLRAARFPSGFGAIARPMFGFRGPRRPILGVCVSGTVVEPGDSGLAVGASVSGMTGMSMGGHAQLVAVGADRLVPNPVGVDAVASAAVLFGGSTALHFLADRVTRARPSWSMGRRGRWAAVPCRWPSCSAA